MNATWPLTKLPSGTIVLPFATTSWITSPLNVSPGLLVLEVSVVPSRIRREVPGGILGITSAPAASPENSITVASVVRRRFMGCPFLSTSPTHIINIVSPHGRLSTLATALAARLAL